MKKIFLLFVLLFCISIFPQQLQENKYGLRVVDNTELYTALISSDSSQMLVDLEDYIPGILIDVRYATENNFYGKPVYSEEKVFLRKPAADSLRKVQEELVRQNKSLKIFDAYRPYNVTVMFYEKIKDTNFVASAYTGSRHNRGCAVDLTIVDLNSGSDLKMPTEYDDFTEKAAIDYMDISKEEMENRTLLLNVMLKYGFNPLKSEWWHYDFKEWKKYEITDISFYELGIIYSEYKEETEYAR